MGLLDFRRVAKDASTQGKVSATTSRDSPWVMAEQAHNNTYLRLGAQVANWRLFAFFCLGITAFSVAGMIWLGSQPKFKPYLVEVDKLGRTIAVRALDGNDAISDPSRTVYRELFDLIENLRTVTTDRDANNRNLNAAFARLSGAAATYARTELRKAPPNEVGKSKTVQVHVTSALKLSEKSWQLEWDETSYNLKGEVIETKLWKATLEYEQKPGGDADFIRKNPIGFFVTQLNWAEVIK